MMRKHVKQVLIPAVAALLGYAAYMGTRDASRSDVDVLDLIQTSDADAECNPFNGWCYGRCLNTLGGFCVFDTSEKQCTP